MEFSRRGFFAASALAAAAVPSLVVAQEPAPKAATSTTAATAAPVPGQLTEEQLGNLLKAMGLKAEKVEKRFDFVFRSVHNKEDWDLSMTAVLSADNKSIWIMAWLDELPKSAADVPRTALLRLLAANDRLGHGKFFAYVASNRRFVMQRIIPNENISTKGFRDSLQDLGLSVVEAYPYWSVSNWGTADKAPTANVATSPDKADSGKADAGIPAAQTGLQGAGKTPTRTATATSTTDKKTSTK